MANEKGAQPFLKIQHYCEIVVFIRKKQWYLFWMALAFPAPFVFYFFYHLRRKRIYRNHPRKCKVCNGSMRKLSGNEEDEFLSKGMQMKKRCVRSTMMSGNVRRARKLKFSFFSTAIRSMKHCPKFQTMAYHFVSKRTITSATYSSSGSGEEVHACKFCGYTSKKNYTMPRWRFCSTILMLCTSQSKLDKLKFKVFRNIILVET